MSVARIPFSAADERAIDMLNGAVLFLLIVHFVIGALMLVAGCLGMLGIPTHFMANNIAAGAAALISQVSIMLLAVGMIAQGALLAQIRGSLASVLASDTNDQAYLGIAFSRLKLYFMLEAVLFIVIMGLQAGTLLTQALAPESPFLVGQGVSL